MISFMKRGSRERSSQSSISCSHRHIADLPSCSIERIVREASADHEQEKIAKILKQLCDEYAFAVHQPYARNGGLIGLAAASIALGSVRIFAAVLWKRWI